jgi:hypothetical protein
MNAAIVANNGVMHPREGSCLAINLVAATPTNLDCTTLVANGEMITLRNDTSAVVGYKFSSSPTPNISIAATSGAQACSTIAPGEAVRGYAPYGCPHLHLVSVPGGMVYAHISTVNR